MNFRASELHGARYSYSHNKLLFLRDFWVQLMPVQTFYFPFLGSCSRLSCLNYQVPGRFPSVDLFWKFLALSTFLIWPCVSSKEMTMNWPVFHGSCLPKRQCIYLQIMDWGGKPCHWVHPLCRRSCLAANPMRRGCFSSVDTPLRQKTKRLTTTGQFREEGNSFVVLLLTPLFSRLITPWVNWFN